METNRYLDLWRQWAKRISDQHKDLNFVRRYRDPNILLDPAVHNPDGSYSTHLMSYSGGPDPKTGANEGYDVYPELYQPYWGAKLKKLQPHERPKESIHFGPNEENQASVFSEIYKTYPWKNRSAGKEISDRQLLSDVLRPWLQDQRNAQMDKDSRMLESFKKALLNTIQFNESQGK